MPVWTRQWTSPELSRRRRLMSLNFRAMDRHRHRPPQFMDSAERRRTRDALVVDVGTPHKDFSQQRDPPVVAVGGKTTGILCALKRTRQLRKKVAIMDINDRHEAQRRVHTFAEKQRSALSTNALTSTRTRWCSRPFPCIWTAWETRKTVR